MKHGIWVIFLFALVALPLFFVGCASTVNEAGNKFDFKPDKIVIGTTTKRDILESYGRPTTSEVRGKYEVLTYQYSKESFKHGRAVGMGALSAIPVLGLATLAMDQGVKESDMAREYRVLSVYTELSSGIVKDFYYHDSDLNGQDESETLYLKANKMLGEGKDEEAIKTLEQAVSLNPRNHRALNSLAWTLIDLNIDIDKGVAYAERAVGIFPDSPYSNGTLGCGYYKKGQLEKAEKYLSSAVKLFPIYAPRDTKALMHDRTILKTVQDQKQK